MIDRNFYLDKIIAGFRYNPIVILTGARQVGKTSLMEMYSDGKEHLWLNGENPETAQLFGGFSEIERFLNVKMGASLSGLLIIDEFQYIPDISLYMKLLVDKYKELKILCSGSSSLDTNKRIKESLAGRVRRISVYPLRFPEYVRFRDEALSQSLEQLDVFDKANILFPKLEGLLNEYLLYGGLPKVALANDYDEKKSLLNDIYQTYLLKDVRQYIENKNFVGFNKILRILSSQVGNLLNINELSKSVRLSYIKVEEYVDVLEQMYVIQKVSPFYVNVKKEISKMQKVFFYDIGLRNVVYNSFNDINIRTDNGQIFENCVFLQLLNNYDIRDIHFYRTKDGTEIDFVLKDKTDNLLPIEVKFKNFEKHKKIRALSEFMRTHNTERAYIVNLNYTDSVNTQKYLLPYLISKIEY